MARSSREWSRRVKGEGRARCGRPERHDVAVALRRPFSTCAPGMAPRGEAEMLQENQGRGESPGSARGRRRRRAAANGAGTASQPKQREEME